MNISVAILAFAVVSACQTTEQSRAVCANDMQKTVLTSGGCFAIDSARMQLPLAGKPMVVFIHGDGGPGGYRADYANQINALADAGLNPIVLVRPGYRLPDGDQTTGYARDSFGG